MSINCQVDCVTPTEWALACGQFADYSIYQTWAFGNISAGDTGSQISRVLIRDADVVIGAAQVRIKKIPYVNCGLAYVYFGPMSQPVDGSQDRFQDVLSAIREQFAERRGLGVRVVPHRLSHGKLPLRAQIETAGFAVVDSIPVYRTFIVDLKPDVEILRSNLAQKWRNGLNQSEKRGVVVEFRQDDEAMGEFEKLYEQMWSRKQFETGVAVSSFCRLQRLLQGHEKMTIQMAYKDGAFVAGHLSSTLGDSCIYLLGASNARGRGCRASYALQWHAMIAAKRAGARWYDLGGIDPIANPGVHHFKAGLGGVETTSVGTFEAPARGVGRFFLPLAERVYRSLRSARRSACEQVDGEALHASFSLEKRTACPSTAKLSS